MKQLPLLQKAMIRRITHACILLLAMCAFFANAQAAGTLSLYEGRHFLLGFMKNEIYTAVSSNLQLRMYIATKRPTNVRVTMPWGTYKTYALKGDSVLTVALDPTLEMSLSEVPQRAAVELASDEPIAVYAFSSISLSSDAYAVLPTTAWGTEYFALCMSNDQYNPSVLDQAPDSLRNKMPRLGEFMVIASEDSTTVYYEPTAPTLAGIAPGSGNAIVLNKGECLLVKSAPAPKNFNDLTGSYIIADKPVGFLSGHMRTSIPHLPDAMDGRYDTKNHLVEMIPPVPLWGSQYVSVPYGVCSEGDYFRVVASQDNTTLTMESDTDFYTVALNKGEFAEFENVISPALWKADQPVLIGQYMYSDFLDPTTNADPSFVTLPPVNRFTKRLLFQAPSTVDQTQFNVFSVQLICTADALGSLQMNGIPIADIAPEIQTQSIRSTGLYWAIIDVSPDQVYRLTTSTGSFSGIIFAYGHFDSYSVPLGMSIDTAQTDTLAPLITASGKCGSLKGVVQEQNPGSGIFEVYVEEAISYNYGVHIAPLTDTSTSVEFTASPIDLYSDAYILLTAVDHAGNQSQTSYRYKAPVAAGSTLVSLPKVEAGSTICAPMVFTNNGDSSFAVTGMYIMSDTRATINGKPAFPLILEPGESITVEVCYTATDDTTSIRAQVLVRYGCDLQWWVPVSHTAEQPAIAVLGHDFGGVRVGDTTCAQIAVVNVGKTPLLITQLSDITLPEIFLIDTAGVFPHELAIGDTLWLQVCFTPPALQPYEDSPTATTVYRLPNLISLTGYGIAPEIVVAGIDWKQRRTGTANDSVMTIANLGTCTAVLTMPLPSSSDTAFFYEPEKLFPMVLPPSSSVTLPVRFLPTHTVDYRTIVSVAVDWKLHPPVEAILTGSGTLPSIATTDILFDTIAVDDHADTTTTAITAGGNELLTVDSLFFAGGDKASFIVPENSWRSRMLAVGSASLFTARFAPQRAGWHRARVAVVHDAQDNYKRDTAYFELAGFAVLNDVVAVALSIQNTSALFACHEHQFTPVFDNTGSTLSFAVDSLVVELFGADTTIILPPGVVAEAGKQIELPAFALTLAESGSAVMLMRVHYHLADNEDASPRTSTLEQPLIIQRSQLTIVPIKDQDVVPWDIPSLHMQGEITEGETFSGSFAIHVGYNFQSFRPMYDTTTLVLVQSNGGTIEIPAQVAENRLGIVITPELLRNIALPARWSVLLPLFVFLDTVQAPEITVVVPTGACLLGDSTSLAFRLTGVCSFAYRNIRYRPVAAVDIRPNPVAENAFVDISLPEDEVVAINIVDQLGRTFTVAEKMYLKKGKYSYKLSVADLNSGLYSLVVILSDSVSLHHFLINK